MSAMSETDNRGPQASPSGQVPLPPDEPAAPPPGRPVPEPTPGPSQPPTASDPPQEPPVRMKEVGGPAGPEPTRYGDWERKGRVSDF
jgi:homeobox protein ESX1